MLKWPIRSGNLVRLMRSQLIPNLKHALCIPLAKSQSYISFTFLVFSAFGLSKWMASWQVHLLDSTDPKGDCWPLSVPNLFPHVVLRRMGTGQNVLWANCCVWSMKSHDCPVLSKRTAMPNPQCMKKCNNLSLNSVIIFWRIYKRTSTLLEFTVNIFIGSCMWQCLCQSNVALASQRTLFYAVILIFWETFEPLLLESYSNTIQKEVSLTFLGLLNHWLWW